MTEAVASGNHPAVKGGTKGKPAADAEPSCPPRSLANLRKFIDERTPGDKQKWGVDPAIEECLKTLRKWLQGKKTDQQLDNALNRLCEAQPSELEESEAA
jgi:hypothetical protein